MSGQTVWCDTAVLQSDGPSPAVPDELNERTLQGHRQQAELHEAERRRREQCQRLARQLEAARAKLRAAQESQTARSARPAAEPAKVAAHAGDGHTAEGACRLARQGRGSTDWELISW